jgi:hypothetical protein
VASTTERASRAKRGKARRIAAAVRDSDRIDALHDQLTDRIGALVGGDQWRAMLASAARFHRYSFGNVLLIAFQRPDATRVAGYRTWQRVGRQVRKGERGIAILAPCTYRASTDDTDDADGTPEPTRWVRGWRVAYVFDVSQTDGEPLPDVLPVLLRGDDPGRLWDALAAQVRDAGYALTRGDCDEVCPGSNGFTDYAAREVRVRADVDPAQACKTLAHELGHVLLHADSTAPRKRCEVEAESVAYVVCHASGLDTDDYSLPYVAGWANGDLSLIRASAQTVTTTARRVLDGIAATTGALSDPLADVTA